VYRIKHALVDRVIEVLLAVAGGFDDRRAAGCERADRVARLPVPLDRHVAELRPRLACRARPRDLHLDQHDAAEADGGGG
jgi:hypothetical protein